MMSGILKNTPAAAAFMLLSLSCSGDTAYRPFFIHRSWQISESRNIGFLSEVQIIPGVDFTPDPHFKSLLKMNLMHTLHNSGVFLAVTDQPPSELMTGEQITEIKAKVHPRLEYRIHRIVSFFSVIPFPFLGPLQQKSGCATVALQLNLFSEDKQFAVIRVTESVPYFVRFYSFLNTTDDERAIARAYKKAFAAAAVYIRKTDFSGKAEMQQVLNQEYDGCRRLSPYAEQ